MYKCFCSALHCFANRFGFEWNPKTEAGLLFVGFFLSSFIMQSNRWCYCLPFHALIEFIISNGAFAVGYANTSYLWAVISFWITRLCFCFFSFSSTAFYHRYIYFGCFSIPHMRQCGRHFVFPEICHQHSSEISKVFCVFSWLMSFKCHIRHHSSIVSCTFAFNL